MYPLFSKSLWQFECPSSDPKVQFFLISRSGHSSRVFATTCQICSPEGVLMDVIYANYKPRSTRKSQFSQVHLHSVSTTTEQQWGKSAESFTHPTRFPWLESTARKGSQSTTWSHTGLGRVLPRKTHSKRICFFHSEDTTERIWMILWDTIAKHRFISHCFLSITLTLPSMVGQHGLQKRNMWEAVLRRLDRRQKRKESPLCGKTTLAKYL